MEQTQEPASILAVDDSPESLWVLVHMLERNGYRVLTATSGEEALAAVVENYPDMILLDVRMPGLDGLEVCRRLKRERSTEDIPVIFLSAMGEMGDKIEGLSAGAVDYITKPFHAAEVRARLETHLRLRRLQRDLKHQIELRNELIAELDAFAHTVAHDLKDPLCLVMGYVDMLRTGAPKPAAAQIQAIEGVERTAAKMGSIIDELLLLSSVRKVEVVPVAVDMGGVVARSRQRVRHLIAETQAQVSIADTWPYVMGHAPWLEQVWVNFLSNACKYGGQRPKIELGWAALEQEQARSRARGTDPEMIKFWVRDHGQGIPAAEQAALFAPFARLQRAQADGHGLGLSIVQRIVTRLNGQVGIESALGQGSTFYFTLPSA